MIIFYIGLGIITAGIGTLAGSGGLISFPALILSGLPVQSVISTNKLANTVSSSTSLFSLIKKHDYPKRMFLMTGLYGLIGGLIGGVITSSIPTRLMTFIATILLLFAFLFTFKKSSPSDHSPFQKSNKSWYAFIFGIGAYNGAFGPGQGTVMMQMSSQRGFDYMTCIGLTRINTLSSSLGALVSYLLSGFIVWSAAIPFCAGAIIGGQLALLTAPKLSQRHVKWMLRGLTLLLLCQLAVQLVEEVTK